MVELKWLMLDQVVKACKDRDFNFRTEYDQRSDLFSIAIYDTGFKLWHYVVTDQPFDEMVRKFITWAEGSQKKSA